MRISITAKNERLLMIYSAMVVTFFTLSCLQGCSLSESGRDLRDNGRTANVTPMTAGGQDGSWVGGGGNTGSGGQLLTYSDGGVWVEAQEFAGEFEALSGGGGRGTGGAINVGGAGGVNAKQGGDAGGGGEPAPGNPRFDSPVDYLSIINSSDYVLAPQTRSLARFLGPVAISDDGNTLAIGGETGANCDRRADGTVNYSTCDISGAVYLFVRRQGQWHHQATVRQGWTDLSRGTSSFGNAVALAGDGNTLVVGAYLDSGCATGVNGDPTDKSCNQEGNSSGSAFVFVRLGETWRQTAFIKASNADSWDRFGVSVALSGDGRTLAVGAAEETGCHTDVGVQGAEDRCLVTGASYVFSRTGETWAQQALLKAPGAGYVRSFASSVALNWDGDTLAVGARHAAACELDPLDPTVVGACTGEGMAYVFTRTADRWAHQAYIKASDAGAEDRFGGAIALDNSGRTLAVGASDHGCGASEHGDGLEGCRTSGAVYVFERNDAGDWAQSTPALKPHPGSLVAYFGGSIALSGDGRVLMGGAAGDMGCRPGGANNLFGNDIPCETSGAAYLWARTASGWIEQGVFRTPINTLRNFGARVACNRDGTALAFSASMPNCVADAPDYPTCMRENTGSVFVVNWNP